MANPLITEYIKRHCKDYGIEIISKSLLEEGISEEEINQAITELINLVPDKTRNKKIIVLVCVLALLIVTGFYLVKNNSRSSAENANVQTSAAPVGAVIMDNGVYIPVPTGYNYKLLGKKIGTSVEVLLIYPLEISNAETLSKEEFVAKNGIYIEIARTKLQSPDEIMTVEEETKKNLAGMGLIFTSKWENKYSSPILRFTINKSGNMTRRDMIFSPNAIHKLEFKEENKQSDYILEKIASQKE